MNLDDKQQPEVDMSTALSISLTGCRRTIETAHSMNDASQGTVIGIEKVVNEMKNNSDEITEKDILEKIMRTLSGRFDYVVTAIEESKDLNTKTLNDLQASLESNEIGRGGRNFRIAVRQGARDSWRKKPAKNSKYELRKKAVIKQLGHRLFFLI
ncbi:hypothetical protein RJ639_037540 [Escallonia herrerae]|uniref:Uncharacterized protein n=1 Tax=Escallonia herrerae TaxID=1293975 RepID=A0AA89B4V7_9ASTE|nr:hypothetical protein RJ639_037540 [Escallonia herrerae]